MVYKLSDVGWRTLGAHAARVRDYLSYDFHRSVSSQ